MPPRFRSRFLSLLRRFLCVATCSLPGVGFGALSWKNPLVELTTEPGAKIVTGIFTFVNSGNTPVVITTVETECGCTTAELAKRTYAPKEAGEIKAVFTIGDRVGLQEKSIHVTTDDAPGAPVALTLRVTVPELLTFSARMLSWNTTEVPHEKSIMVGNAGRIKIISIDPSPATVPGATVRIEAIEEGRKYRIFAKPASNAAAISLPLKFIAKFADQTTQEFPVYLLVR